MLNTCPKLIKFKATNLFKSGVNHTKAVQKSLTNRNQIQLCLTGKWPTQLFIYYTSIYSTNPAKQFPSTNSIDANPQTQYQIRGASASH